MKEDASGRRQRAVMATDAEWERIGRAAAESGMDLSRFVIHRALDWDPLPAEVLRRAVREMLVLARLEERRLRGAGAGGSLPWTTRTSYHRARGTSVDASVDASLSSDGSAHAVRCSHLSGLMMRLV